LWNDILTLTSEHLFLVAIAMLIAVTIGVPLGILITRRAGWRRPGAGRRERDANRPQPGAVRISDSDSADRRDRAAYRHRRVGGLRDVADPAQYTGRILGVDAAVRESAVAMGMTPSQILRQVELPLAARTIFAGIRVATVTTIGTATIAAAIGGGGLGVFHFSRSRVRGFRVDTGRGSPGGDHRAAL
jgi:osmoprotectant transport system permease protein